MTEKHPHDSQTASGAIRHAPSVALFLIAIAVLLTADLLIKSQTFQHLADAPITLTRDESGQLEPIPPHESVTIVPKILALHLTANEGAVFGLGRGGRWIFIIFSIAAVAVIAVVFSRSRPSSRVLHLALAAVLAGALGNLYDRLFIGVVRDMFWLFPGVRLPFGLHWPGGSDQLYPWIFNLADACLVIGLFTLMILMYRHDRKKAATATDHKTTKNQ